MFAKSDPHQLGTSPLRDSLTPLSPWIVAVVVFVLALEICSSTIFFPAHWGVESFKLLHAVTFGLELLVAGGLARATWQDRASRTLFLPAAFYSAAVAYSSFRGRHGLHFLEWIGPWEVSWNVWFFSIILPTGLMKRDYFSIFAWLAAFLALTAALDLGLAVLHIESLHGHALLHHPDGRGGVWAVQGIYQHRNTLGAFFAFFPALTVLLIYTLRVPTPREHWRRAGLAIALVLISANLMLSFSRSSQIAAVFSLALPCAIQAYHFLEKRYSKNAARVTVALTALLLLGIVFSRSGLLYYWLEPEGRQEYLLELLQRFQAHRWFGYGLLGVFVRNGDTPHSAYLAQLLFYGIVGSVAFLWLFGALAWQAARRCAPAFSRNFAAQLMACLLVGIAMQGLVEYIITYPLFFANSFFLLLLGCTARGRFE